MGKQSGTSLTRRQFPSANPDWKAYFDWLRRKATKGDIEMLAEFDRERRRQAAREEELGNLK